MEGGSKCPARDVICMKCQKKGHFMKVCRGKSSTPKTGVSAALWSPTFATVSASAPGSLLKSSATVNVNGWQVKALFDSGSSESFIHPSLVETAALPIHPSSGTVSMATSALSTKVTGFCVANLVYQGRTYESLRLLVLPGLCADLILGLDFQSQYECRLQLWWS